MRFAGVDYGSKRIGLATSDDAVPIAFPAEVIAAADSPKRDAENVAQWGHADGIELYVVGLPLNMDGTVGPQAKRVQQFADALRAASGKPVEMWDERLTSFAADESLRAAGFARPKQSGKRDAVAAQVILAEFLRERAAAATPDESNAEPEDADDGDSPC